jgi:hypothetical protein
MHNTVASRSVSASLAAKSGISGRVGSGVAISDTTGRTELITAQVREPFADVLFHSRSTPSPGLRRPRLRRGDSEKAAAGRGEKMWGV